MSFKFSSYNSYERLLLASSHYQGSGERCEGFEGVFVVYSTDKETKLTLEWSLDNLNWDFQEVYDNMTAGNHEIRHHNKGQFFRVRVDNKEASNMTYFRLGCKFINDVGAFQTMNKTIYSNEALLANVDSNSVNVERFTKCVVYGETDTPTNIEMYISPDQGTSWYLSNEKVIMAVSGQFYLDINMPGQYVKFRNTQACNLSLHMSLHN